MKRTLFRTGAAGLAGAVVAALAVAGATPASAAPNQYAPSIGTVIGAPASGATNVAFNVKTNADCPAGTTVVNAFIDRPSAGWTEALAIGGNTDVGSISTTGIPMGDTLTGIAQTNGLTLSDGTYDLSLVCYPDSFGTPATGQFDGTFTVTGTNYAFSTPAVPTSTTTLSVSPPSPQDPGTNVTLTANVTSTAAVAGTVNFKDNGTTIGSAPVASGSASFSTNSLAGGAHSLTAEFVPTDANVVQGSTSAAVSYTINSPAQATTTTLSSSPASPTTADVVSLTATLTPATATGTVAFKEGATTVGTATVSGGTASVSLTGLSAGTHTYTADFTPSGNFLASSAAAYSITVTQFTGVSATETITATVPAGTLTITAGGTVDLGTLALNSGNSLLVSTPKDMNTVTVTDTRAGNVGWTVNGQVSDFTSGSNAINGENLGWTPRVVSQQPVQNVSPGAAVPPGAGVAVGASTGAGLKTARVLATAAPGGSLGTAELTASLLLQAPTSSRAGAYSATLTLTAV